MKTAAEPKSKPPRSSPVRRMAELDGPLRTIMYDSSPTNLPVVRRELISSLDRLVEGGNDMAWYILRTLSRHFLTDDERHVAVWREAQRELLLAQIESRVIQKQSLMPDGVVSNLTPEELADLMAYLQSLTGGNDPPRRGATRR